MLIGSLRHRPADHAFWDELFATDVKLVRKLPPYVARARGALAEFVRGGGCYVGTSWGKDSVVVVHLAREFDVPVVNLRCVPSRNPDCDLVRDAYLSRFDCEYREELCDYGSIYSQHLPLQSHDVETDKVWNAAWRRVNKWRPRHISGVRSEESNVRRIRMMRWGESTKMTCAPIGWWPTWAVFAYLAAHDLPTHPAYGCLGGGRWPRDRIRVAEIGDSHGRGGGRAEWEAEYYSDVLRRIAVKSTRRGSARRGG